MDFAGRYTVAASPELVWAAINDPEILKSCIPGCQSLVKTDPTHFEAAVTLKIGPVKATFKGKVALEDLDPPRYCLLRGEGQGGVAGFARGEAKVTLTPEDAGTVLTYEAKASVGGKLAQIGQRLIDGAAKQIADDFFSKFASAVAAGQAAEAALEAETLALAESEAVGVPTEPMAAIASMSPGAPEPASPQDRPSRQGGGREGLPPEIWVAGLIAVIIILLVLFGLVL